MEREGPSPGFLAPLREQQMTNTGRGGDSPFHSGPDKKSYPETIYFYIIFYEISIMKVKKLKSITRLNDGH